MADRIAERRFLPPEDAVRQQAGAGERLPQQVLALAGRVQLAAWVDGHDVAHKVEVAERHPRFEAVGGQAAVGAQHVVGVQLPQALFGLLLEGRGAGGVVGVFIAEQFVRNFAGQQRLDVGLLVDGLTDQIHAHAGADGRDVVGGESSHDVGQHGDDLFGGHQHLGVVGPDVARGLARIFQINGVGRHADGKSADGLAEVFGRNGADQAGIQPAREQKAHPRVGVQPLDDGGGQLFADVAAEFFRRVVYDAVDFGHIGVRHKLPVLIIMPGREGADLFDPAFQLDGLAGKGDAARLGAAVKQRPDADGVARGDKAAALAVVQNAGELGVQPPEHIAAVFAPQRQQHLAVGIAAEAVAFCLQFPPQRAEAVNLAVARRPAAAVFKRLHAFGR